MFKFKSSILFGQPEVCKYNSLQRTLNFCNMLPPLGPSTGWGKSKKSPNKENKKYKEPQRRNPSLLLSVSHIDCNSRREMSSNETRSRIIKSQCLRFITFCHQTQQWWYCEGDAHKLLNYPLALLGVQCTAVKNAKTSIMRWTERICEIDNLSTAKCDSRIVDAVERQPPLFFHHSVQIKAHQSSSQPTTTTGRAPPQFAGGTCRRRRPSSTGLSAKAERSIVFHCRTGSSLTPGGDAVAAASGF